jgi:hypothetical protein
LEGAIAVILGFLLLPGSVIVLLASNFGALKGYLIGGAAFFGFLLMLAVIWTFGVPGTPALTGPVGPLPEFVHIQPDSAEAERFPAIAQYPDGGWQPAPEDTGEEGSLASELSTAEQSLVSDFIAEHNAGVEESSQEADITNLEVETFYTVDDGTEVAAVEISPGDPIPGSGLERPDFETATEFAYRDPGFPNVYNYAFLGASAVLFVVHMLGLIRVERRSPLGWTPQTLESEARRSRETAGV